MSRLDWSHDGRRIFVPLLILRPSPTSDITHVRTAALLDTGATSTGIARRFAVELGLTGRGKKQLISAQGRGYAERYLFRVGLPIEQAGRSAEAFPFIFDEILGFELVDGSGIDAVLGMDILRRCDLSISRDGRCSLTFG